MVVNCQSARVACSLLFVCALTGCFRTGPGASLVRASRTGNLSTMKSLLDHGADPNATGAFGMTPLASAARNGMIDAIELLLARGADPHRGCGVNGWTPLQHALHKDQLAAAQRLLAVCSPPSPELDDALFMAAGYAQTAAVAALLEHGANPHKDFGDGANALSNAVSGAFDIDFSFRGCAEHTATVRTLVNDSDVKLRGSVGIAARRAAVRRNCTEMLSLLK